MASNSDYSYHQTKVELSLSCTQLLDMDTFSKSDPFIVLYQGTGQSSRQKSGWVKMGRTEVIYDNLNPKVSVVLSSQKRTKGLAICLG